MFIYLKRSGPQILLDIRLDLLDWERHHIINTDNLSESPTGLDIILSILDHIIPHLYRIRSLLFKCFSESTCLNTLFVLRGASVPNLRQLEIKFDLFSAMFRNRLSRFRILQHGSSQLTFLKIDQTDCLPVITSLRMLTSLHSGKLYTDRNLSYPTLVEVLTAPDCLLYLSVAATWSRSTWPVHPDAPGFQLHHLKALRIYD